MVPEGRATRCCVVVVAAVCVWAAACAQSQPVDGRAAAQPAVGAAEGAGVSGGGSNPDRGGGLEGTAEPDGGGDPDGGVVDRADGVEGTAEPGGGDPDGGVVDAPGVSEGAEPERGVVDDGGIVDGEGVSEGVSGPGGSGRFRQPGELVGDPGRTGAVVGVGAGPLRSEHSRWEAVMGEVFDMCDYYEAATAVTGRVVGPGDEVSELVQFELAEIHLRECGSSGEPRYAHVTWSGPGPVRLSREEATEAVQESRCLYGCGHHLGYGGDLGLGYSAFPGMFAVEVPADGVVLLWDSVALRDGELLGLVQNRSATLFGRAVTVTLGGHSWVFPLTVQPGEVAPFVVGSGTVSALPDQSEIEVSATMSPQPDLSRSFRNAIFPFHPADTSPWDAPWVSRYLADPAFALNRAAMDLPLGPGDWVRYWFTGWELEQPNSHPGVAAADDQVFEDMRAYLTFLNENTREVIAVHRLTPVNIGVDPPEPLSALPIIGSDGRRNYGFTLEFVWLADSEYDTKEVQTVMHVGAAAP